MVFNLNRDIWNGELPKVKIVVKKNLRDNARGWYCDDEMEISRSGHKTVWDAWHTVAHEMIHHAQNFYGLETREGAERLNHNGAFFRYFARKIASFYNVNLKDI